jgi:hypothetical protein
MDHPVELPPAQPWRAAALVATAIAIVELFVLVMVGVAFGAKFLADKKDNATAAAVHAISKEVTTPVTSSHKTSSSSGKEKATATGEGKLSRRQTSVIVLNGNGIPGAAATTSDQVRALHYVITATGNAPRTDFNRSVVMFRPGFKPEAQRLAKDMHIRRVAPLDGISRGDLQGAHLALIIGG